MFNIKASDFTAYEEYEKVNRNLINAMSIAKELFNVWNDVTGAIHKESSWYYECLGCIEDAAMIGIEEALGIPHLSETYNIDEACLDNYDEKCRFCEHGYLVYGCEQGCDLEDKELPCELKVMEEIK